MALYIAQARGLDVAALEKVSMVRDGFSVAALIFGPFWLLYRRLWLLALLWFGAEALFVWLVLPHVMPGAAMLIDLLAHVYLGFEGRSFLIARAARRAAVTDVVEGRDAQEAELRFFERHHAILAPSLEPQP